VCASATSLMSWIAPLVKYTLRKSRPGQSDHRLPARTPRPATETCPALEPQLPRHGPAWRATGKRRCGKSSDVITTLGRRDSQRLRHRGQGDRNRGRERDLLRTRADDARVARPSLREGRPPHVYQADAPRASTDPKNSAMRRAGASPSAPSEQVSGTPRRGDRELAR